MQRRDDAGLIWWLTQRLLHMNNFSLRLQLCLRVPAARLLLDYWTIYCFFPKQT